MLCAKRGDRGVVVVVGFVQFAWVVGGKHLQRLAWIGYLFNQRGVECTDPGILNNRDPAIGRIIRNFGIQRHVEGVIDFDFGIGILYQDMGICWLGAGALWVWMYDDFTLWTDRHKPKVLVSACRQLKWSLQ